MKGAREGGKEGSREEGMTVFQAGQEKGGRGGRRVG